MRPHLKMLAGNYLTFEIKSAQSGGSPLCRLCDNSETESLEHLISSCQYFSEARYRIISLMANLCKEDDLDIRLSELSHKHFTQFILDPSSLNLTKRVNITHPLLPTLFQLSRDFCYYIDSSRKKALF